MMVDESMEGYNKTYGMNEEAMALQPLSMSAIFPLLSELTDVELVELYNLTGASSKHELTAHIVNFLRSQLYEKMIQRQLILYISPVLILMGTIGNLFSFFVLRRKTMRKISVFLFLSVLVFTDTVVLYVGLLRLWLGELIGFPINLYSSWLCKILTLTGYMASDLSCCLIVAVAVERYVAVRLPLRASSLCTVQRTKKIVVGLFIAMFLLNSHFLWTVGIVNSIDEPKCIGLSPYESFVSNIWPWMDAVVYSFLPFIIVTILNMLSIKEVLGAKANKLIRRNRDKDRKPQAENRKRLKGARLTVMLISVSFTFLLLTLPNNIVLIVSNAWEHKGDGNQSGPTELEFQSMVTFHLVNTVTQLLMYANHSINFFLYCATGDKFRQETLQILACCCRSRHGVDLGDQGRRRSSCNSVDYIFQDFSEDSNLGGGIKMTARSLNSGRRCSVPSLTSNTRLSRTRRRMSSYPDPSNNECREPLRSDWTGRKPAVGQDGQSFGPIHKSGQSCSPSRQAGQCQRVPVTIKLWHVVAMESCFYEPPSTCNSPPHQAMGKSSGTSFFTSRRFKSSQHSGKRCAKHRRSSEQSTLL